MDFSKILAKLDSIESKKNLNEGWEDMMKANKEKAKEKGTDKFDKKDTGTGTVYTRKSSTFSDGGDDKDTKKAKEKAKKSKVKEGEEKVDEDDVEEGNEFSGARDAAIKAGKKDFKVGDKTYQVKESKKPDEDGDGVPDWADKKSGKDDNEDDDKDDSDKDDDKDDDKEKVDEAQVAPGQVKWATANADRYVNHYTNKGKTVHEAMNILYKTSHKRAQKLSENAKLAECYDQAMGQMEGEESGMNISSNMDTKTGNKSLTVSARGEAAEQLAQILKLSGLVGHSNGQEQEMAQEEYANEPKPMVQSAEVQFKQGNDLNRPKGTYPKVAGGDNPMGAMMEDKELSLLESRLKKELDSIKVKK